MELDNIATTNSGQLLAMEPPLTKELPLTKEPSLTKEPPVKEPPLTKHPSLELEPCNITSSEPRALTAEDIKKLVLQDKRGVLPEFHKSKLEQQTSINWDKFYKRNETR